MHSGQRTRRLFALAAAGLVLAALPGCVRIGSKPPDRLLGIATDSQLSPGANLSASAQSALFVEQPNVPRSIQTQRVAVRADSTSYAYVKKAMWVDTPARQFRTMLSETIAARTGRLVLDPNQYPAETGQVLHGELLEFGIDARTQRAVVTYDASLLSADGQTVRRQRFSSTRPVGEIDAQSVAPAISEAANRVAQEVADWVGTP